MFVDSVPYLLFVFLALAWGAVFPDGGGSNAQYFGSTSLATVLRHVRSYGKIPSDFYLGIPGPRLVYFASVPFLLAGIVRSARAECHVVFYVATSAVLLLIWPYTQGLRYVVPLMPFYVHYLFVGIRWAVEAVGTRWRPFASAFAMGTLIIIAALFAKVSLSRAIDNMHAHRAAPVGPYMETAQAMFDFVKGGTGEDATIIFFKPRAMRMLTGRPSIAVDKAAEVERGDYVCFHVMKEPFYQLSLGDVVRLVQGGRLVSVYANPDFRVYRVIHSMGRA